ncbi:MAG: MFS transporter [Anaerolineae bacterium]|jgi:MFS transporter, Spinster family, sphingosine-1-phosphate transporter|nr:MFS transporter [Anaerolineae bacterium]MBT7069360.1 MFS transporter [Anaerolineae bacterium]MBT7323885.1 MFS transporter [Anaerolineae bacterium]
MTKPKRYRWRVVGIFFAFMLLHQTDKLLIGPLKGLISEEFGITNTQFGLIISGALIVSTVLYPIWGYLYDRYARSKLLALASFIWGSTTWLSAIVRTYIPFVITRASTGIDDSSYPGLYSLIADYFEPNKRSKVYGILQLSQPIGYLIGMVMALMLAPVIGWRTVFYITGALGIVLSITIYFGVKEMPRGKSEPEFEGMDEIGQFNFSWDTAKDVFKKKTMWFVLLQGFAGVFPWNVITYFFFDYLAKERGYDEGSVLMTMAPVILILAGGYFVGGALGDWLFKRTLKGRVIVSSVGVLFGAIFLSLALNAPIEARTTFFIFMALAALFMPFSSPNVVSTVYDVTMPEVRSTAQSVEYFVENAGAALAPLMAGIIADATSMHNAILSISLIAWGLSFLFYFGTMFFIDADITSLRVQMAQRAADEKARQAA